MHNRTNVQMNECTNAQMHNQCVPLPVKVMTYFKIRQSRLRNYECVGARSGGDTSLKDKLCASFWTKYYPQKSEQLHNRTNAQLHKDTTVHVFKCTDLAPLDKPN